MKINTVRELVDSFGDKKALAKKMGVTTKTINLWIRKDEIPAWRVLQIEELSGGFVKIEDLRSLISDARG